VRSVSVLKNRAAANKKKTERALAITKLIRLQFQRLLQFHKGRAKRAMKPLSLFFNSSVVFNLAYFCNSPKASEASKKPFVLKGFKHF